MNKETHALHHMLTRMDNELFEIYAGLINARSVTRHVSAAEELDLLRWMLQQEYSRTQDPEIIHMQSILEQLLQ